jgi:cytochrome b6
MRRIVVCRQWRYQPGQVPWNRAIVGPPLVLILRGGESVGQSTLTRFYSAHTFVLPVAAAVLILTHFLMIRKQGISGPL